MKKFLSLVVVAAIITGCNTTNNNNADNNSQSKGKCVYTECIKQIKPENTVEEINNIIGVTGKLTDEKYNEYYWELSDTTGITVTYYSSKKGAIELDYEVDQLKNSKVNLNQYENLKTKVSSGITYNEFKSYVGNVDGVLVGKDSYSQQYVWVNTNGGYVKASFSNSTGKCSFMSGLIK